MKIKINDVVFFSEAYHFPLLTQMVIELRARNFMEHDICLSYLSRHYGNNNLNFTINYKRVTCRLCKEAIQYYVKYVPRTESNKLIKDSLDKSVKETI